MKRAYREATSEAPNGILIQVLLVAARMDNLEVAVDTARSLAPRLSEGDEKEHPGRTGRLWQPSRRRQVPEDHGQAVFASPTVAARLPPTVVER